MAVIRFVGLCAIAHRHCRIRRGPNAVAFPSERGAIKAKYWRLSSCVRLAKNLLSDRLPVGVDFPVPACGAASFAVHMPAFHGGLFRAAGWNGADA
ncbi:MAG: hypothetical protein ABI767_07790 [Rhodanobacter sp.]